jgi:hypothetical protein
MLGKHQKKKGKDKANDDQEDMSGGGNFQDALKTINVIFRSDSGFPSSKLKSSHSTRSCP